MEWIWWLNPSNPHIGSNFDYDGSVLTIWKRWKDFSCDLHRHAFWVSADEAQIRVRLCVPGFRVEWLSAFSFVHKVQYVVRCPCRHMSTFASFVYPQSVWWLLKSPKYSAGWGCTFIIGSFQQDWGDIDVCIWYWCSTYDRCVNIINYSQNRSHLRRFLARMWRYLAHSSVQPQSNPGMD